MRHHLGYTGGPGFNEPGFNELPGFNEQFFYFFYIIYNILT